jgi:pimeloyl-ACP methyl ester carboxylesterase
MSTSRTLTQLRRMAMAAAGVALVALLMVSGSTPAAGGNHESKPTVVLVHGAWADSSGWRDVIARLEKEGFRVLAPANPLRSLEGDSAYLASFLAQEQGPFVLVGHSYGGAVITNAAAHNPDVEALVYINGFVPDVGEDILHLAGDGSLIPSSIEFKGFPPFGPTDVDVYIKPGNFRETFAADVPKRDAAVMAVTQRPLTLAAASGRATAAAWKTIPSWYLLGRQDRTITPAAQRFMADRAGSKTAEINSSHLSMVSQPRAVVDLIEDAAGQDAVHKDDD